LALVFGVSSIFAAFPNRTITVICPWSPGGGTDLTARFIANKLEEKLGKPAVVANKTGGNGAVGHSAGAYAKADGYTICNVTLELATVSWMGLTKVNYKNFEPVIQFNQDYFAVTVAADAPWNNIKQLLDDVKKNPSKFIFSGSRAGTIWDLARIGLLDLEGIDPKLVKWVPTGGAAPAVTELLGGHVQVITFSYPEVAPLVEAGKLKTSALMAPEREAAFSNIPTLKENGINWVAGTWRGFAVPKGTPKTVVNKLYKAVNEITDSKEFKDYMKKKGFDIKVRGPVDFAAFIKAEHNRWGRAIKLAGYAK
jgi:tripartite-type tricarboxylate transporter receptor subunit TctC